MKKLFTMLMLLLTAFTFTNAQTVTFQVDMSVQIAKGAFDAANDPVAVRGSFNDWGETAMTDDNNDGIYVAAVAVNANEQLAYKYYYNNGAEVWEDGDNKTLDVASSDITVDVTFFNGETMPSGDPTTVTFTVDLRGPANKGDFDPTADSVYVAGSFNDWGTGATAMADNGDTTYTVAVDTIASAQVILQIYLQH